MSAKGFVLLWQGYFDHPYWTEKRVFSRAEAWLDCWARLAAFKDHKRMIGGQVVEVKRGEFVASDRFLELRWKWSRSKVRRFIAKAIAEGELLRVGQVNGTCSVDDTAGGTTYVIVNYDTYQPRTTGHDTGHDTAPEPRPSQRVTRGNKGKQKQTTADGLRPTDLLFDLEWDQYPKKVGKSEAKKAWDKLVGKHDMSEVAAGIRRYTAYTKAEGTDRKYIKHLATLLNGGGWADEWPVSLTVSKGGKAAPQFFDYSNATETFDVSIFNR